MKINLNSYIKGKDHDGYKAIETKEMQWHLYKEQFEFVGCMTPEGPSDDFSWKIMVTNFFTGDTYELKTLILGKIRCKTYEDEETGYSEDVTWYQNGRTTADDLIEKMKAKGELNLDNWIKVA
nr:MAG TPA: hypothetical protein [Caudoviricetes sp.]